jgi:hypothetical protein
MRNDRTKHPTDRRRGSRVRVAPGVYERAGKFVVQYVDAAGVEHFRPILATAVFAGFRQSEILGLRWQDIDLDEGVIRVRHQLARATAKRPARLIRLKTEAGFATSTRVGPQPAEAQTAGVRARPRQALGRRLSDEVRYSLSTTATSPFAASRRPRRRRTSTGLMFRPCRCTTCATPTSRVSLPAARRRHCAGTGGARPPLDHARSLCGRVRAGFSTSARASARRSSRAALGPRIRPISDQSLLERRAWPLPVRPKPLLYGSGAYRDRTGDLRLAKPALSQLS